MRKKVITIFSVICIILVFICAGVIIHLSQRIEQNPEGTIGNTAGNLYNGGLFCEDDGYVYFSNPYDNYALYRMTPKETDFEKLIATETGSINAAGKYFYYYQKGSGSGEGFGYMISTTGIYRAEKKNPQKVKCLDRILSDTIVLADNSIYYNTAGQSTGLSLKRVDITGKTKESILDYLVTPACVYNSTLYFNNTVDNGHLMAIAPGSARATSTLKEDVYMPVVDGKNVYYIDVHDNYSLACYNMSSRTKLTLVPERVDMFNISDNYIYYQTAGKNPQFKRVTNTGASPEVIAEGAYCNINITSEYVYFTEFNTDTPVYKTPVNGEINVSTFDTAYAAALDTLSK